MNYEFNIDGLKVLKKRVIRDERGAVLHMLRNDSEQFKDDFGEIYFSKIVPGITKGWKTHLEMTQRFVVPVGEVLFCFYDSRTESPTYKKSYLISLSEANYKLIVVPTNIAYAFRGTGETESLIANCASIPHNSEETILMPLSTIKIDNFNQDTE
jgi:dTDP-4-dehydrorhamnose 3,5-epimerase